MPQPRKFATNAERQKAYRLRKQGIVTHRLDDSPHSAPNATACGLTTSDIYLAERGEAPTCAACHTWIHRGELLKVSKRAAKKKAAIVTPRPPSTDTHLFTGNAVAIPICLMRAGKRAKYGDGFTKAVGAPPTCKACLAAIEASTLKRRAETQAAEDEFNAQRIKEMDEATARCEHGEEEWNYDPDCLICFPIEDEPTVTQPALTMAEIRKRAAKGRPTLKKLKATLDAIEALPDQPAEPAKLRPHEIARARRVAEAVAAHEAGMARRRAENDARYAEAARIANATVTEEMKANEEKLNEQL